MMNLLYIMGKQDQYYLCLCSFWVLANSNDNWTDFVIINMGASPGFQHTMADYRMWLLHSQGFGLFIIKNKKLKILVYFMEKFVVFTSFSQKFIVATVFSTKQIILEVPKSFEKQYQRRGEVTIFFYRYPRKWSTALWHWGLRLCLTRQCTGN